MMRSVLSSRDHAHALQALFIEAGYVGCEPPMLQPADVFLDNAGEDLRGRLLLSADASGKELCLRPELTIPACRAWLQQGGTEPGRISCAGPVFRQRQPGPTEFYQAGLENFGRTDLEAADAEVLALVLSAASKIGKRSFHVTFGDAVLFQRFVEGMGLPLAWRRRILRGHRAGKALRDITGATAAPGTVDHSGLLAALDGADRAGARALVEDLLAIAGIAPVGGRSASEIADRFLEQAALRASGPFPTEKQGWLEDFLQISGDPDKALRAMRRLAATAKIDLQEEFQRFETRLGFFTAHGLDVASLNFSAAFTRPLDYYTGFMFEAHEKQAEPGKPVLGGGRYDHLMARLSGGRTIPAVGGAVWVERLSGGILSGGIHG